jgi:ABC-type phosphate transport system permease subunit
LVYLVVLIVLAVAIYALYGLYKKNKAMKKLARRNLNMAIDILRGIFHIIYTLYLYPFVMENKNLRLFYLSFWLLIAAFAIFMVRNVLKWIYFCCGRGKDVLEPWENPFILDEKKMKKSIDTITELNENVRELVKGVKSMEKERPLRE